jgi:hypothetical protein
VKIRPIWSPCLDRLLLHLLSFATHSRNLSTTVHPGPMLWFWKYFCQTFLRFCSKCC